MKLSDRLEARALMLDELYLRASRAELAAAQEKDRADRAEAELEKARAELRKRPQRAAPRKTQARRRRNG